MYTNVVLDASGDFVKLEMKTEEAKRMFHDINRMLSLLNWLQANQDDGLVEDMDAKDQAAYNRVNDFVTVLQHELSIEPSDDD